MFYVAQGPTDKTLDDFLRMIVEQKIELIIMLSYSYDPITRQFSEEHVRYFPDQANEQISTEFFIVKTRCVIKRFSYIGRKLSITSKVTNETHKCEHFHYPDFIDKSVPDDYYKLIGLVLRFLEEPNRNSRILVHCSAGVGRSGVFIVLYYALEAARSNSTINIRQLVNTIRFYRAYMVQTEAQYEYIYRCFAEALIHPCDGRSLEEFVTLSEKHLPRATSVHSTIYQDFQSLNDRVEHQTFLTTKAANENPTMNRDHQCVPYDYNRVILHSPSESMYINGSEMSNIVRSSGIILTQEPMRNTFQPFVAMLFQKHKGFIVSVEQMEKPNYIQLDHSSMNTFRVHNVLMNPTRNKMGEYYHSYCMKIRRENVQETNVFVFEYTGSWTNEPGSKPVNLEQFVRFVDRSIYHQRKHDPSRLGLVVHDRTGGTKAAFYCIVQNLFDRLLIDQRVAIANFSSQICQQRLNALCSLEQYIALHEIVCIWQNLRSRGALECLPQ